MADQAFNCCKVRRKQAVGVAGRNLADAGERNDFRRDGRERQAALEMPGGAGGVFRGGRRIELRDARDERGERGRRFHDQHGKRIAPPAGLQVPLAEVQPVAARLHFARATEIGHLHFQPVERIAAGNEAVVGKAGAELEREGVERPAELLRGED